MPVSRDDVLEWLRTYAGVIADNNQYLTQLDAAIGDADHGANMNRGFQTVLGRLPGMADKDIGTILKTVGMTLISTVGGAGGPLYGTFFIQAGTSLAGKQEMDRDEWIAALDSAIQGVISRGKAEPGDKTMVDALLPALQAAREAASSGQSMAEVLHKSAQAAEQGMKATIPLVARKGRASYLGDRSAGHQDPGATSSFLLLDSAARAWSDQK